MFNILIVILFVLAFLPLKTTSENGVCTATKSYIERTVVPRRCSRQEKYREHDCWFYNCWKTRTVYYDCPYIVSERKYKIEKYCCIGFSEKLYTYPLKCEPHCPDCPNGHCDAPYECLCNSGYTMSSLHKCEPHCSEECSFGTCISPEVCECNFGYQMSSNNTCEPVCSEECVHGKCVRPETCQCDDGYQMSLNDTCEPICSTECVHGKCVRPETCQCDDGYQMSSNATCEPICSTDCVHGRCVRPETCQCDDGYQMSINDTCEPICSNECLHGKCVRPDTCQCDDGYQLSSNGTCEPFCSRECVNGKCVGPETCLCDNGYHMLDNICSPYCSKGCPHGVCIGPDQCLCYSGYQMSVDSVCEPLCSDGCEFGRCVEPDTCECDLGYIKKNSNVCIPYCKMECGNGTCTQPNACTCLSGYTIDIDVDQKLKEGPLCIPKCANCDGTCIAPNYCVCPDRLKARNLTAGGTDCVSFDTLDDAQKCNKTICVPQTNNLDTSTETLYTTLIYSSSDLSSGISIYDVNDVSSRLSTEETLYYLTGKPTEYTVQDFSSTFYPGETLMDDESTKYYSESHDSIESKNYTTGSDKFMSYWMYILAAVVSLILFAIFLVIILKRSHFKRGKGNYSVRDEIEEKCNTTVILSEIKSMNIDSPDVIPTEIE